MDILGTALTGGAPSLARPALHQEQVLSATALSNSAPAQGSSTITASVPAAILSSGKPMLAKPALRQQQVLSATTLSNSAPVQGTPTVVIAEWVAEQLSSGTPLLASPALHQKQVLQTKPYRSVASQTLLLPTQVAVCLSRPVHAGTNQALELPRAHCQAQLSWASLPEGWGSKLLYRAATGLEKALADSEDRLIDINAEIIKDTWDPYTCPLPLLPYLAWAMGVEFWNDKWTETTKRAWTAVQWDYKSKRGTKEGVSIAVDFAGRDVSPFGYKAYKFITQPQKVFSGPSLTKAEREAWLALLPQVRVYYYRDSVIANAKKAFVSSGWARLERNRRFFFEGMYAIPSEASKHLARRATWNVNGVDTDTTVTDFGNYYQLHLHGIEDSKVFSGRPCRSDHYYVPSDAWKRLYTIAPMNFTPWRVAVGPALYAVTAEPELVAIPGQRGLSVYTGSNYYHGTGSLMNHNNYFIPSTSRYRLYDRYAVDDGSTGVKRPNTQFMGTGRYGWPKFTAEVSVHMPGKRSPFTASNDGIFLPKRKYWIPHDPEPVRYVCSAIESSRRMADKILLRTGPIVRFIAGRPFLAGVDHYVVGRPDVVFDEDRYMLAQSPYATL